MTAVLKSLAEENRRMWSTWICHHLMAEFPWAPHVKVVGCFSGLKAEPDLLPLLALLNRHGAQMAFFSVGQEEMTPYLVKGDEDLVRGVFGILEPRQNEAARVAIADIDAVLVPGLAFSPTDGSRIGRGRGYYDRFLAHPSCRALKIGIGFSQQFIPDIPTGPYDVPVDALVSEEGWIKLRPSTQIP